MVRVDIVRAPLSGRAATKELVQRKILNRRAQDDLAVAALDFDLRPLSQPDGPGNVPR